MILFSFVPFIWAVSAKADFFQFDSISNASTYYFNYIYCNVWDGECQPNQEDATQQGKEYDPFQIISFFRNDYFNLNQMHIELTFAGVFPGRHRHIRGDVQSFRLFSGY